MSVKIVVAAGLTATAGGVAWVTSSHAEPEPVVVQASAATPEPATEVVVVEPEEPAPIATPVLAEPAERMKRWSAQRSKIQAAHAISAPPPQPSASPGFSWHAADDGGEVEVPEGEHEFCAHGEDCLGVLAQQVHGLVEGCEDFMDHEGPALSLTAHIIGAPGVGTIVETVELSSGQDAPQELQECLTESMYTLELGPAEHNFDRDITVMLGGEAIDLTALAGSELDDETRAAIEDAIAQGGGNVQVLHLGQEH